MSIGIVVTKADCDSMFGNIALDLKNTVDKVIAAKEWLDGQTVEALVALGYTEGEANVLKSAWADAAQFATVFTGASALADAKDFRVFLRQLYGFGRR